jgi:hypothetical protein
MSMGAQRRIRHKIVEWLRRYAPAEAIDSIIIRPIARYLGPLVVGNTAAGFVLGSIVADIAFYVMAIFSYERFANLLARPQPASVPA